MTRFTAAAMSIRPPLIRRVNDPRQVSGLSQNILNTSQSTSIKVVTDIDDTVKSSGGVKLFGIPLGGIDTHFKRGEFYPGVFQFSFELSQQNSKSPPKIAVLTARARELLFALALKPADKLCSAFRRIGAENGHPDWGVGVGTDVYYGSVLEWILQERKGLRKFNNFEIMLKNDALRGCKENYVLIGDTGEKDEEAGERIARMYPKRIKAVFLHVVSANKDRSKLLLPPDRVVNGVPFMYFQTYVGAAFKAKQIGLLGPAAVQRVIAQAKKELGAKVPNKYIDSGATILNSKWLELERDIAQVKKSEVKSFMSILPYFNSRSNGRSRIN